MVQQKFFQEICFLIKKIPKGKVSTYKALGEALNTKAYRAIGRALHSNKKLDEIPCYKIVKSNGEVGGYVLGVNEKIKRLKKEGIKVKNKRIENFAELLHKFT